MASIQKAKREKIKTTVSQERLHTLHKDIADHLPLHRDDLLDTIESLAGVGARRSLCVLEQLLDDGALVKKGDFYSSPAYELFEKISPMTPSPQVEILRAINENSKEKIGKTSFSKLIAKLEDLGELSKTDGMIKMPEPKVVQTPVTITQKPQATPLRTEKIAIRPSRKRKKQTVKKHDLDLNDVLAVFEQSVPKTPDEIAMGLDLEFSKGSPNRHRLALALDELILGGFINEQNGRFIRPFDKDIDPESTMVGVVKKIKGRDIFESAKEGEPNIEITNCNVTNGTIVRVIKNDNHNSVRILSTHGNLDDNAGYCKLTAEEFNIPTDFPQDVLDETIGMSIPKASATRHDYTERFKFIATDPETAKDKDDAICVQRLKNGGLRIMVAVADVAEFVRPGSKLWMEAHRRGNSTYFPGLTIPMFPPVLSNGLCSLHQGEIRAAKVTTIDIDKFGKIQNEKVEDALIKCYASLNYDEVQTAIDGDATGKLLETYNKYIVKAKKAAEILDKVADERGQLKLDTPEQRIDYSKETGMNIREERNNLAHQIVANIMILNNMIIPNELEKRGKTVITRAHDEPNPKAFSRVLPELEKLGVENDEELPLAERVRDMVRASYSDKKNGSKIRKLLVRAQSLAKYAMGRRQHYGLGIKEGEGYTHFTSPIRRFSDMVVHSMLSNHEKHDPEFFEDANLQKVVEHISMTERRSQKAEEKAKTRLIANWLEDNMSKVFNAKVLNIDPEAQEMEVLLLGQPVRTYVQLNDGDVYKKQQIVQVVPQKVDKIKGTLHFQLVANNNGHKTANDNADADLGNVIPMEGKRTVTRTRKSPRTKATRYRVSNPHP